MCVVIVTVYHDVVHCKLYHWNVNLCDYESNDYLLPHLVSSLIVQLLKWFVMRKHSLDFCVDEADSLEWYNWCACASQSNSDCWCSSGLLSNLKMIWKWCCSLLCMSNVLRIWCLCLLRGNLSWPPANESKWLQWSRRGWHCGWWWLGLACMWRTSICAITCLLFCRTWMLCWVRM